MIKYEVRQQVKVVGQSWLEVVATSPFERTARASYESCKADAPNAYFELVKVGTTEECLDFTKAT